MSAALVLALDVGGSRVRAAAARGFELLARETQAWPEGLTPEAEADFVADVAHAALLRCEAHERPAAAGVALAALCDADGRVVAWPNRPAWAGLPFRARLSERLGLPVRVEDDANAAALGEWRLGRGRCHANGLVLTLGTGVGAGLVLNGRLYRGAHGWAGELGHVVVQPDGPACACGRRGCLQMLASGRALERVALERGLGTATDVSTAAARGERWAVDAFAACGRRLGLAAANAVTLLDLEAVIVGGARGLVGAVPLWAALEAALRGSVPRPGVVLYRAALGERAGLLGAVGLALEAAGAEPGARVEHAA